MLYCCCFIERMGAEGVFVQKNASLRAVALLCHYLTLLTARGRACELPLASRCTRPHVLAGLIGASRRKFSRPVRASCAT